MAPEMKNNAPMATVIHSTVLSGVRSSKMPMAMAQSARKKELPMIFISLLYTG